MSDVRKCCAKAGTLDAPAADEPCIPAELPADWAGKADAFVAECNEKAESPATRKASLNSIEAYAAVLP